MSKPTALNPDHFLNRLALDEMANPDSIDPFQVLNNIFSFADLDEMQEMFKNFCESALAEKYSWKEGSPGNLLHCSEKLEQLIEACYLVHSRQNAKQPAQKGKGAVPAKIRLPVRLSEKEWAKPLLVLEDFFAFSSLPVWKLTLHTWVQAAFSNYSVSDNVNPSEILSFYRYMEKLIEAAYWTLVRPRPKAK